ncbi:FHA domain-containing protein [Xenophilus sp. Marseille-Q4582]|uniref:FHA domain-containing protein n=1 Tax=Xenophilus sp. Marseille-Q4582 TaxID=2866600 RepID=UPI001CE3F316|nr:FHA domain-containing protein [Xenophilus sp. Marseille-Q4582]
MPKLVVAIDGVVLKEVLLAKERTTLGRRPYNDIVIDNLTVSGEHAALHLIDGDVYLEDLNSTNGTYVNARAVRRQLLAHNDVIEVGKYKIRYLVSSDASAAATPVRVGASPLISSPVPLAAGNTAPVPLGGTGPAVIRVLSGAGAGQEFTLHKVVTTIGKPGVAVAAVTRRLQGYVVAQVEGGTLLNGEAVGAAAVALQDGDLLELGGSRMQYVQG